MEVLAVVDNVTGRTTVLRMKADSFEEERILAAIEEGIAGGHLFTVLDPRTEETFAFFMGSIEGES